MAPAKGIVHLLAHAEEKGDGSTVRSKDKTFKSHWMCGSLTLFPSVVCSQDFNGKPQKEYSSLIQILTMLSNGKTMHMIPPQTNHSFTDSSKFTSLPVSQDDPYVNPKDLPSLCSHKMLKYSWAHAAWRRLKVQRLTGKTSHNVSNENGFPSPWDLCCEKENQHKLEKSVFYPESSLGESSAKPGALIPWFGVMPGNIVNEDQ
ncbi:hypothetical protein llap_6655 [Limosa lapponica baueri]|uniref:Uncharacterized protein n=1 Tax=Limosa lapponica baueri TaxID=1758121 RepID=A0A2I0UAG1_LIMLA|nr:hypothetical protein llap_6655 [Limosa lapponica baueri]